MFKKLSLERTECYGTCPIYQVEVTPDGMVYWNGEGHVSFMGQTTFQISEKKVQQLASLLESFDYRVFTYKEGDLFATDMPHCITRVEYEDGFVKEVDHYLGDIDQRENHLKHSLTSLEKFEKRVERIIGTKHYVEQYLFIYHIRAKGSAYVVSAPNQEEAVNLAEPEMQCKVNKIGKDTTGSLFPYVVMKSDESFD
ncbi:DUF6438 domain-containing protein [Oceanobacillus damuensis]|uniref:DUF6438 domain-containing protein n=1 Tax=Oceanobacillus damuensis TaxID=937928 RepID=UPI00082CF56A|nr:DUF6438 domain-containing protein [Oceanobacillus damuensis]